MTIVDKLKAVLDLAEKANKPMPPGEQNIFWNANAFADARGAAADFGPSMARALLALWPALEKFRAADDQESGLWDGSIVLAEGEKKASYIDCADALLTAFKQAKKELE